MTGMNQGTTTGPVAKKLSCACCGETMERGFIWLAAFQPAELLWQQHKPKLSFWTPLKNFKGERLMASNQRMTPKSLRCAHRCPKCKSVLIENLVQASD
jgi:hypothetical protein